MTNPRRRGPSPYFSILNPVRRTTKLPRGPDRIVERRQAPQRIQVGRGSRTVDVLPGDRSAPL